MSKIVSAIVGAALVVVGALTGNWQLILAGVSMVGSALLTPKVKQQARQASNTTLQLGEVPRECILGTAATAGSLGNAFNYGGKYGTDWEVLSILLADHECEALVGFYVNDKYVAFTGDGAVAGYNGQLQVYFRPGTEHQSIPAVLSAHGGYAASDNGAGICHVTVCYKADDSKAKNPVWPSGRPRFLWVVKGLKCYDPRADATVPGGSGAQRWNNVATRQWTDNTIVCRYNWVRGIYACNRIDQPDMLLVGRGLTATEAPPENVAPRANLCDEPVALTAGGTEPRYRCGGSVKADDTYLTVEEFFASAVGGVITQPQGCVEIEPGQAKAPSFFFTDDDLIVGSEVRWDDFLSEASDEWVNTVIPRYVEPSQKWADHAAPIRRSTIDVIADGGPREETLSLPIVTSATQAGRLGEIRRRLGRLQGRGSVTLGPRYSEIEEGDWGVWYSARRFGGAGRTVRVEAWSSGENGHVTLVLRQISASCYSDGPDFDDGSVADEQDPPPDIPPPEDGSWTLTAESLDVENELVPALVFTGEVDDDFARFVRLEYWLSDDITDPEDVTDWVNAGVFGPDVTRYDVTGIVGEATYYGAVSYVVGGVTGPRLILGPVVTDVDPLLRVLIDFNAQNNRNGAAIPAPTIATDGTAVDHVINADGSADMSFEWGWSGANADIDGHQVMLVGRTSNVPYVPGTSPADEDVWTVPADKRAALAQGLNPTAWYTWAVRAYRRVDKDVDPSGVIVSAWATPTRAEEKPYRPSANARFLGDLSGTLDNTTSTAAVIVGVDRAANAIKSDYTIANGKVLTASIAADQINNAGYGKILTMVAMGADDENMLLLFGSSFNVAGGTLVVEAVIPVELEFIDPDPGDVGEITLRVVARHTASDTYYDGENVVLQETWRAAAATGAYSTMRRSVSFAWQFTGLPAGTYGIGYYAATGPGNNATIPRGQYIKGEDMRAIK